MKWSLPFVFMLMTAGCEVEKWPLVEKTWKITRTSPTGEAKVDYVKSPYEPWEDAYRGIQCNDYRRLRVPHGWLFESELVEEGVEE